MFRAKFLLLAVIATLIAAEYKIEKGHNATRGQFPFYVFIKGHCGGALISNQWIVTAASPSCLKFSPLSIQEVHLGSLKVENTKEEGRKIFNVTFEGIHKHPKYSRLFGLNDIALIKLPEPVEFSDVIKPIHLACPSNYNVDVTALGYGYDFEGSREMSPVLLYTELKTISKLSCMRTFPYLIFKRNVVCAKGGELFSKIRRDYGSPLVTSNNFLIGLTTSAGLHREQDSYPQVFTEVTKYLKWIEEVTGIKCEN